MYQVQVQINIGVFKVFKYSDRRKARNKFIASVEAIKTVKGVKGTVRMIEPVKRIDTYA